MDGMIQTGRFFEFVTDFTKTISKEKEEQTAWEFFLHKVWEGTFEEFQESTKINSELKKLDKRTIETTVQDSLSILKDFKPKEGGEK